MSLPRSVDTGGYSVKNYKADGGEETERFSATLVLDGKPVAQVSNDGRGGSHNYRFTGDSFGGYGSPGHQALVAAAKATRPDAYEPADELVSDLLAITVLNRSRSIAFVFDGDDFFGAGQYRKFDTKTTLAQAIVVLTQNFADKHPAIWDSRTSQFLPVTGRDCTAWHCTANVGPHRHSDGILTLTDNEPVSAVHP